MARVTNFRGIEIIFEEIFPNIIPFVITGFSGSVIGAIMGETGLRLVGVGPAEIPSIGYLLEQASKWGALTSGAYNVLVPPILFLVLIFISLNLINVGLDERFNPKLRKITGE
jgi:peptide/nickel transport system permease protein